MMQVALEGCAKLAPLAISPCRLLFLVPSVYLHSCPSPTCEPRTPAAAFFSFGAAFAFLLPLHTHELPSGVIFRLNCPHLRCCHHLISLRLCCMFQGDTSNWFSDPIHFGTGSWVCQHIPATGFIHRLILVMRIISHTDCWLTARQCACFGASVLLVLLVYYLCLQEFNKCLIKSIKSYQLSYETTSTKPVLYS
jgi:hypothetical protein